MKTIRNFMILVGTSLAVLVLAATGAKGQTLDTTYLTGTFTLPFEAQWGHMTLPAGEYTMKYGRLFEGGIAVVGVVGKAEGSPHGWVVPESTNHALATKNALVCIRQGNRGIVRGLELAEIGESVSFALPRGAELMAKQRNHNGYTQIAAAPMLIQRVPIIPSGK